MPTEAATKKQNELSSTFSLSCLQPTELADNVFTFFSPTELAKLAEVNKTWRKKSTNLGRRQTYLLQQLRSSLRNESLAYRLLEGVEGGQLPADLIQTHCYEAFGMDVREVPLGTVPGTRRPLGLLATYFQHATHIFRTHDDEGRPFPCLDAPERFAPQFYGGAELKENKEGELVSETLPAADPATLLQGETADLYFEALLEKTQKASAAFHRLQLPTSATSTQRKSSLAIFLKSSAVPDFFDESLEESYACFVDFLEAAYTLETFLADVLLCAGIWKNIHQNRGVVRRSSPPLVDIILPCFTSAHLMHCLSKRSLLVLSNLKFHFFCLNDLLAYPILKEKFQQFTSAEIFFLMQSSQNFAQYMGINAKDHPDIFIPRLSQAALSWLMQKVKGTAIRLSILNNPVLVARCSDEELIEILNTTDAENAAACVRNLAYLQARLTPPFCLTLKVQPILAFVLEAPDLLAPWCDKALIEMLNLIDPRYAVRCIEKNAHLRARMTPEFCLDLMRANPLRAEIIMHKEVLRTFSPAHLVSFLEMLPSAQYVGFAQCYSEGFAALTQDQLLRLIAQKNTSNVEDRAAAAILQYALFQRFYPEIGTALEAKRLYVDSHWLWVHQPRVMHVRNMSFLHAEYDALQKRANAQNAVVTPAALQVEESASEKAAVFVLPEGQGTPQPIYEEKRETANASTDEKTITSAALSSAAMAEERRLPYDALQKRAHAQNAVVTPTALQEVEESASEKAAVVALPERQDTPQPIDEEKREETKRETANASTDEKIIKRDVLRPAAVTEKRHLPLYVSPAPPRFTVFSMLRKLFFGIVALGGLYLTLGGAGILIQGNAFFGFPFSLGKIALYMGPALSAFTGLSYYFLQRHNTAWLRKLFFMPAISGGVYLTMAGAGSLISGSAFLGLPLAASVMGLCMGFALISLSCWIGRWKDVSDKRQVLSDLWPEIAASPLPTGNAFLPAPSAAMSPAATAAQTYPIQYQDSGLTTGPSTAFS